MSSSKPEWDEVTESQETRLCESQSSKAGIEDHDHEVSEDGLPRLSQVLRTATPSLDQAAFRLNKVCLDLTFFILRSILPSLTAFF